MTRTIKSVVAAGALWLLLAAAPALAQSSPGWTYGYVPTVAQWNAIFASKQDYLGAPPLLTTGGTMVGPLVTAASIAGSSGFNLPPGTAPSSPVNGDLWTTSASIYARINGVTYDLLSGSSGCAGCALLASSNTFTASPQTVQGLTTTSPGWYAQVNGDAVPRVRVGLNATDVASIAFGPGNANRDAFIERIGAGALRFGAPDAASPVAQVSSVQNVVAGTSNTAGANRTFSGSQGTGTGVGGAIIFQVSPAGLSGSAQNALVTAAEIFGTGGIVAGGATGGDKGAGTINAAGLFVNGSAVGSVGNLTVASTTIAGGSTTRVLYDNAGVLNEYLISGTGSVAMTANPTFTGTLGAANIAVTGNTNLGTTSTLPGSTFVSVSNNVGTTIPTLTGFQPQMVIVGADATRGALAIESYGSGGTESSILLFGARNIMSSPQSTQAGDFLGELGMHGYGSGQFLHNAGVGLIGIAVDNFTSSTAGEKMSWFITPSGTGTAVIAGNFEASGGITLNGPTGGDKGLGTINATGLFVNGVAVGTSSLVVGATAITSGTSGRVLFDNGGTLGEYAISGSGSVALTTSPTFTTPNIGAATATTINGNTFTSGSYTLTGAAAKTLTFSNSIALAGTDGTTMTFPSTSASIARTDAAQTFTGQQTFAGGNSTTPGVTVGSFGFGMFSLSSSQYGLAANGGTFFDFGITTGGRITIGAPLQADGAILSIFGAGGIGYGIGSAVGGTITQATSRTTGVTLNKATGAITLVSAPGSATPASFTLTNSAIAATDVVKVTQQSGIDKYEIFVTNTVAGSCQITSFTTGGTTTEQPVFNFVIIKGSSN